MPSKSTRGLSLDSANIMSTVLEGILYGFSVPMFMSTIWTFTYKQRIRDINRPVSVVATLLFILSTAHMIVGIMRVEDGLVNNRDIPGGPAAYFADVTQQSFATKNTIITLQTLLGDGVVIYRCYVVWQSVWIIILPCMMWCGVAAFGICMVYAQAPTTTAKNVFSNETGHWITTFLSLTLATNLLSSGLLAYRIWTIERNVSGAYATKNKMPILRVLIDAALLYSAALCTSLACFALFNNGFYVMGDLIVPIISIVFYMVFIRVAIGQNIREYLSTTICGGINESDRRTLSPRSPVQPSMQVGHSKNDISSWPTATP
ncbi:hypothetical protein DEU56DRAFT_749808 [Suillus clintonianus]|uniref:uncharacterized protein n=1 Tax=Suillus clintonianus TaxID=1904413 RepID=UPI001B8623DF|nr:uncharacterized protein DEU56DRAFT_749808 [Suillus clintonianus]KAG2110693.1 hypothetical protein DEU56DRAFT_749808 [Suillus clintonianus]